MTDQQPGDMYVLDSPYELSRWRPLANWILVVPHWIIQSAMQSLSSALAVVVWFGVVFTGRILPGLYGALAMIERYSQRATSFLFGFSERYPPFDFDLGPADGGAYPPVRVNLPEAPETTPRTAAFNFILAIPHYIVLAVFAIGAVVVLIIGWFAVLFTGAWPAGLRGFLVRFDNYWLRVWAYVLMVHTKYPRFGL